jgi:flagellar biosynthesis protein FlhA
LFLNPTLKFLSHRPILGREAKLSKAHKNIQEDWLSRIGRHGDLLLALAVFGLMFLMIVPVPTPVLDMLLATSIAFSVLLFLGALYARKPVEFSVFPTMLLVATVFRLALNVASTRRILLDGSTGPDAAGRIIEAFGQFVVGGDYVVGAIVFTILVVINFIVVTKGAGRVAEVSARFTLDAMPGKQMAIDAELNSGLIDEKTARTRREEVSQEADFYGAMDGASKFVRGDAIAGIIITVINVVGGVLIGTLQDGLGVGDAMQSYVILTIGDGLAGQVPALVVSTAAALLVTRVTDMSNQGLHEQIGSQLLGNPRLLGLGAGAMGLFALIPGLHIPFSIAAVLMGSMAYTISRRKTDRQIEAEAVSTVRAEPRPEELLEVEPLAVEVAVDLLYLVDLKQGGELLDRITKLRKQFAKDLGIVLPPIHLRDNLNLPSGTYRVLLRGEELSRGRAYARQHLALDPGTATQPLKGIETTDPVFGLPAWWISDRSVLEAQEGGYTVVDVPTVVTTHLIELMHIHGHELFDAAQMDTRLEALATLNPRLVEDVVPDPLPRTVVLRVFRNLVREGVSIRDVQTILEALSDYATRTRDADVLTEFVRQRLARHITQTLADENGTVHVVTFGGEAEQALLRGLQANEGGAPTLVLDPDIARDLVVGVRTHIEQFAGSGQAVLLCPPLARGAFRRLIERVLPRIPVVSSSELLPSARIQTESVIELTEPTSRIGAA